MNSGAAHAWLFAGLINDHTRRLPHGELPYEHAPQGSTGFAPCCCGPCGALKDYFNTARGRAEIESYWVKLGRSDREWVWAPGGVIDWNQIQTRMDAGFCPNHEE